MATDNKQKVLIRSMSVEEIENYLCTSDLNGKITPKNEDTWHQSFEIMPPGGVQYFGYDFLATILTNLTKNDNSNFYIGRKATTNQYFTSHFYKKYNTILSDNVGFYGFPDQMYSHTLYGLPVFRPLIEYKE